jgi:hypothetical protein
MQHVLTFGPDYNASEAPSDLGMCPKTFRAYKSKAYRRLRVLIPAEMRKRGIEPGDHGIPDPELDLAPPVSFPSEETEE